jgi:hypothetical protein
MTYVFFKLIFVNYCGVNFFSRARAGRRRGLAGTEPIETRGLVGGTAGTSVNGKRSVTRLVFGTSAIAASVAFLVSGCSETSFFPAVHDMPAPRADTPLTPDQVKQATDALTSERDHLNTQIQPNGQPGPAPSAAAVQQKPPSSAQPAAAQAGATQTAGADPKP